MALKIYDVVAYIRMNTLSISNFIEEQLLNALKLLRSSRTILIIKRCPWDRNFFSNFLRYFLLEVDFHKHNLWQKLLRRLHFG